MKKTTQVLGILLLIISQLSLAQEAKNKSLLWKISGKELATYSFLYGTIHIICEDNIRINEAEIEAFASAQKVYLELDLDNPQLLEEMRVSTKSTTHLKNHISAKGYNEIDDFFTHQLGYSMEAVGMVKPYYLLSYTFKPSIGCEKPVSIEQLLVSEAKQQQKEIIGLETLQQQTEVFDKLNTRKQARLLLRQIRKKHLVGKNYKQILNFYQSGDVDALHHQTIKSPSRRLNNRLLKKRNEAWVKNIVPALEQQSNFIAVGAAHLGGNKGLIQLLRKQGYTVEAVN